MNREENVNVYIYRTQKFVPELFYGTAFSLGILFLVTRKLINRVISFLYRACVSAESGSNVGAVPDLASADHFENFQNITVNFENSDIVVVAATKSSQKPLNQ